MRRSALIALASILMGSIQTAFAQNRNAGLRIEPSEISIDLFYSGTHLRVSGVSPFGEDLIVICSGEESTVELKEKKRVGGILWMNGGDVTYKNVPSFYKLATSRNLSLLPANPELIQAGLGFSALEARIVPQPDERLHHCFSELIKLKEHEGLYSIHEGGLELRPLGDDWKEFSTTFFFPPDAGPGTYHLRLMRFYEGKAVELAQGKVRVRLTGVAAFIDSLSLEHGFLYGVFSVVVALAAGLLTGAIFTHRSRKLSH